MKKFNWRKWCDEWALAGRGVMLATRERRFIVGFLAGFVVFGTLMNLLAGGFAKFQLMAAVGLPGALRIIADAVLAILGVGKPVVEWLPTFALATLQGALIGLIVLLWQKKRSENAENVQKAGIITGLVALGAGCPTCGTTLLTPLLGTIFSTGSMAVAGLISSVVTVLAVLIALLSLKRIGLETYVIMVNEKYLRRKRASEPKAEKTGKGVVENGRKSGKNDGSR